jgi:chemotaxis family two-component system response regulator Rcp1
MNKIRRPFEILLIEDNPADVFLISEMIQGLGLNINITVASDGAQAVRMLLRTDKFASTPIPNLVILDLNLPKVHGYEILSLIRSKDDLKALPVVVMTGSLNEDDEIKSRKMGVVDYIVKPVDFYGYEFTCRWFERTLVPMAKRCEREQDEGKGANEQRLGGRMEGPPMRPGSPTALGGMSLDRMGPHSF